jgi:uncharacterized protein YbaR (Trm112 family)
LLFTLLRLLKFLEKRENIIKEINMRKSLLQILICPVCLSDELVLLPIDESKEEVNYGVLLCSSCKRWYPIINGIPHMLPDELRSSEDEQFIKKVGNRFGKYVLKTVPPVYLIDVTYP